MKIAFRFLTVFIIGLTIAMAQTKRENVGFTDQNHDGINDWFRDSNGDGINDVDQKTYQHAFRFQDQDKDGLNDLFRDEDGDGVNDLNSKFADLDRRGWTENIIDSDRNWINDITGEIYTRRSLGGYRYGFVLEEYQEKLSDFTDEDSDGQDDRVAKRENFQRARLDRFIDADGDGVCDQRGFYRHRRAGYGPGRKQ